MKKKVLISLILLLISKLALAQKQEPRLVLPVGHTNYEISDIKVSDDGSFIITNAKKDYSTCIWDAQTGKLISKIPGMFSWLKGDLIFVIHFNDENKTVLNIYKIPYLRQIQSFYINNDFQDWRFPGLLFNNNREELYTFYKGNFFIYNINNGRISDSIIINSNYNDNEVNTSKKAVKIIPNNYCFNPLQDFAFNSDKSKLVFYNDNSDSIFLYCPNSIQLKKFSLNSQLRYKIDDIQFGPMNSIYCFRGGHLEKYDENGSFVGALKLYDNSESDSIFFQFNSMIIDTIKNNIIINVKRNNFDLCFNINGNVLKITEVIKGNLFNIDTNNSILLLSPEFSTSNIRTIDPRISDVVQTSISENEIKDQEDFGLIKLFNSEHSLHKTLYKNVKWKKGYRGNLIYQSLKKIKNNQFVIPIYNPKHIDGFESDFDILYYDLNLNLKKVVNLKKYNTSQSLRGYSFNSVFSSKNGIQLLPVISDSLKKSLEENNFEIINGKIYKTDTSKINYAKDYFSSLQLIDYNDRYLSLENVKINEFPSNEEELPLLKLFGYGSDYVGDQKSFKLFVRHNGRTKIVKFKDRDHGTSNEKPLIKKINDYFFIAVLNSVFILDNNLKIISKYTHKNCDVKLTYFSEQGDYYIVTAEDVIEFGFENVKLKKINYLTNKLIWDKSESKTNSRIIKIIADQNKLFCLHNSGLVEIIDELNGHLINKFTVQRNRDQNNATVPFYFIDSLILTQGETEILNLISSNTLEIKFSILDLGENQFLYFDKFGRFDGTPGAIEKLYFVCGLEVVELNQVKDSLYVPNLVQRIMNGENLDHLPKLSDLNICGVTPIVEPIDKGDGGYHYQITPRTGGVGDIEIYLNGVVRQKENAKRLKLKNGKYSIQVDPKLIDRYQIPGESLQVKVIAKTANNSISSRGIVLDLESDEPTTLRKPSLHAVMIGVDDYKDDNLDLNYAAKDANDLHQALEQASKKFFNVDDTNRVFFYNLTINREGKLGTDKIKGKTPDKANIHQTLEEIEKKSKPEDILLVFFAGHGEIVDKDQLLLLTTEAISTKFEGIRMRELLEQLNKIPAGKRVLILDACHSGAAINNMDLAKFTGKRDVKDAERQSQRLKELDKLASKSGFAIITASSSDQKALELPQYEHGLMTYALLNAMLNNKSSLDENNQLQLDKWLMATEEEVKKLNQNQSAERMVPVNFALGKIDDEVRSSIVLKEIPTVFVSNVLNIDLGFDDQKIKSQLITYFSEKSRGTEKTLFVSEIEQPNSVQVNVVYTLSNNQLTLKATLLKNNEVIKRIEEKGNITSQTALLNNLMVLIEKEVN